MHFQEKTFSSRNSNADTEYQLTTKETPYYPLDVTYHCEEHEVKKGGFLAILKRWFTCKQYEPQSESEDLMLVTTIK